MQPPSARLVLRNDADRNWLEFTEPARILSTCRIDEVPTLVREIEQCVEQEGCHAAGFIAYEAAPAFDPSLPVTADGGFPLLWFGLFPRVTEIALPAPVEDAGPDLHWQPSLTREQYGRCLQTIRTYIGNGDTYQVNFTYRLRTTAAIDPWQLFLRIAGDGEAPFAGFVDTGDWAICSASPELFLRIDGDRIDGDLIESRPMKGTAARGLWFEDDQAQREALVSSEKDRAENLMIVDMVRNDLGRVARSGTVRVPSLFRVERFPTLWQLTSTVTARTDAPLGRLLQATFPPASITGAPKRRTMEIIADLESAPRRIYTGSIGFIAPGRRAQFNVAIRTLLMHKPSGRLEYGVGGGIVWDSTSAGEYAESLTKTRVLRPGPRDFDLLETLRWSPVEGYGLLGYHLRRLLGSADYFGFAADPGRIREALEGHARGLLPAGTWRVRLLVSRTGGVRCESSPLDPESLGFADLVLARHPIDWRDPFLYHKTTRRTRYEDALRDCPGSIDVLLYNERGEATESTLANLAAEIDGVLWTPPLRCGLLPGTRRAMMLETGLLAERIMTIDEMLASPAVYLLNSVRGIHRVRVRGAG